MSTTVAYHADGYGPHRPAIDVKDHHSGMDFVHALERLVGDPAVVLGESVNSIYPADLRDIAYEHVVARFWDEAEDMADGLGLGPIEQEGRSGGWLVLTDGFDPQDHPSEDAESEDEQDRTVEVWLAAYARLVAWCDAQVASAPERVARLAQDYGMDRLGEPAARRAGLVPA